jgi:cytosine/adenosine deaminase-related metal-dependent hydrolase
MVLRLSGLTFRQMQVQSHLSENKGEIAFTAELFPASQHYTAVYESVGLLHERCFMAHCIHLDDAQVRTPTNDAVCAACVRLHEVIDPDLVPTVTRCWTVGA